MIRCFNGHENLDHQRFCGECGAALPSASGFSAYTGGGTQQPDGQPSGNWPGGSTAQAQWQGGQPGGSVPPPPYGMVSPQPAMYIPAQEKSSGIALLLGILWPGAGHVYLGLTKKGLPYLIANIISIALSLMFLPFFIGIHLIVWAVTLVMTVGSIESDVAIVNDAIRRGYRIDG